MTTGVAAPPRAGAPPAAGLVLAFAILGISFAAPLMRYSAASPLAIATWRLLFSLLIIAVPLLVRGSWRQWAALDRRGVIVALGAGVLLAIHFWSWNASVAMTTVAASVLLVNLQPVIVAVLSAAWLGERPSTRQWSGIGIAMLGAVVVGGDLVRSGLGGLGTRAALGDALALVGAVAAALYYLAGRRLRQTLDLWPYVALVYGACFLTLVAITTIGAVPVWHQPPRELLIFAALAAGPMMLGHTGMNWALKYLPAYVVNLTTLGEPVGATVLAALLPGIREVPTAFTLAGGALVLVGILMALRRT